MTKDTRSNPFPKFDRDKIERRGDAATDAALKRHDKDLAHVEELHRKGEADFRDD